MLLIQRRIFLGLLTRFSTGKELHEMKLTATQKWLRTIAWLRRNFLVQRTVSVRSASIKKFHGYVEYDGEFKIRISCKQSLNLRLDALIHEWAHVLTWFGAEETTEHSAEWGIAYAKIYRTFIVWNYGREGDLGE